MAEIKTKKKKVSVYNFISDINDENILEYAYYHELEHFSYTLTTLGCHILVYFFNRYDGRATFRWPLRAAAPYHKTYFPCSEFHKINDCR